MEVGGAQKPWWMYAGRWQREATRKKGVVAMQFDVIKEETTAGRGGGLQTAQQDRQEHTRERGR